MRRSDSILTRLKSVESPDVTFVGPRPPVVMKSARGNRVRDVDGKRYLDFTACFGVLALGHRPPCVLEALRKQSGKLLHGMGDVHPTEAKLRLLEFLAKNTPFARPRICLGLNGGDAIEVALKTAMLISKKHRIVSFSGGYHGLNWGPLSLSDREKFTAGFEPWIEGRSVVVPWPWNPDEPAYGIAPASALDAGNNYATDPWFATRAMHGLVSEEISLTRLEKALAARDIAAVVLEPIQGRGGDRVPPVGFLAKVHELTRKHGALLIFDEIFTGFGRTGPWLALEHSGVIPDILCVGKALGGGLPLSACIGDVLEAWPESDGEARHTSTFLGHPLACATGLAHLRGIQNALPEFQASGKELDRLLGEWAHELQEIGICQRFPFRLRGMGMMRGLWFYSSAPGFAALLAEDLQELGFLALPSGPRGDVLSFTPPLNTSLQDFRKFLSAIKKSLSTRA